MEYLECTDGTAGVYTVMRVDATYHLDSSSRYLPMHTLWDKEFHLKRLNSSFEQIYCDLHVTTENMAEATIRSNTLISVLIGHIQQLLWNKTDTTVDGAKILMLTLLWTPSSTSKNVGPIIVRGHICSSDILIQPKLYDPLPIKAVLALPNTHDISHDYECRPYSCAHLPNRFNHNPNVKMSSWCRIRRPLEKFFKTSDVGEVLLVKNYDGYTWEILEGLTSNIFVLYSDGTLRTCQHGVLEGCAHSMVLKAASQCNVTISHSPITLQDALDGLWCEVFITSAIRIITPVKEILIPDYTRFDASQEVSPIPLMSVWNVDEIQTCMKIRLWKILYAEILRSRMSI
jgi:hypothetical protein